MAQSSSSLPPFTAEGLLPPGDYAVTLDQLGTSFLVTGDRVVSQQWDGAWRGLLVSNVGVLVNQLWRVGIDRIFIDGSFVEEKDHPNDVDGYFEGDLRYLASGQLERDLNQLDP